MEFASSDVAVVSCSDRDFKNSNAQTAEGRRMLHPMTGFWQESKSSESDFQAVLREVLVAKHLNVCWEMDGYKFNRDREPWQLLVSLWAVVSSWKSNQFSQLVAHTHTATVCQSFSAYVCGFIVRSLTLTVFPCRCLRGEEGELSLWHQRLPVPSRHSLLMSDDPLSAVPNC